MERRPLRSGAANEQPPAVESHKVPTRSGNRARRPLSKFMEIALSRRGITCGNSEVKPDSSVFATVIRPHFKKPNHGRRWAATSLLQVS
jgi:hypothetical protein